MAKVQISMEDNMLQRLDEYADRNYTTRSGAIAYACSQMMAAEEMRRAISTMALAMKRIAESNEIDAQSKADLEQFQMLAKVLEESKALL